MPTQPDLNSSSLTVNFPTRSGSPLWYQNPHAGLLHPSHNPPAWCQASLIQPVPSSQPSMFWKEENNLEHSHGVEHLGHLYDLQLRGCFEIHAPAKTHQRQRRGRVLLQQHACRRKGCHWDQMSKSSATNSSPWPDLGKGGGDMGTNTQKNHPKNLVRLGREEHTNLFL